jgi:sugar/nucleoside kinase (ribokinase family)
MRRPIAAGGNFIVDYVKIVDVYPAEQTLANIRAETMGTGGAPYNVLRCLRALDPLVPLSVAAGRVGNDEAGRIVAADLASHEIDASRLNADASAPTSYTLVMVVKSTGKRTFFHQRGANALLAADDFDFDGMQGAHLHFGYLMLLDALDQPDSEFGTQAANVLARAKTAGLTTSIDLVSEESERATMLLPPALRHADVAFMNEIEAARATGVQFQVGEQPSETWALEVARKLDAPSLLVIHWAAGSCAIQGEHFTYQAAIPVRPDEVRSAAGSGDAFAAGFLLCWTRGDDVRSCLRLAACCSASCVRGFTCTDSILSEADCLALEGLQ